MTETGRVIELDGRAVTIKQDGFGRGGNCFGCMNYECRRKGGYITALNSFDLPLERGLRVETGIRTAALAAQAFRALLPPAFGFAAGFFFSRVLFPAAREGARAFGGVLVMLLAGGAFYLFRRKFPEKTQTVVTRIIN